MGSGSLDENEYNDLNSKLNGYKEKIDNITGFYPIYPLTAGVKNGYIAKLIDELLDKKYALPEILNTELRKKQDARK